MSKIQVMSEELANKIAAGEVVERIANVVKELVENSIDANSKNIKIELINSGTKSIKVIDDGIGMDKEDALLAFTRHATSKIKNDNDLFFISTLGFRGEALPSIASVSKVTLKTCQDSIGTLVKIEGGKLITHEASDARKGTEITVEDLFYNTPARLKYLKSEISELANITMYLEKLALSHPEINFTLLNNDKTIVNTSGKNDLLKTIFEIYGLTISSNMLEIKASNDDADIYGFIAKPSILKSNRNHITTIINGRVVKNNYLINAINEGYNTYKPDIKFPVVILFINTDPTLIDVNIHPTKQDIKLSKLEELQTLIIKSIKEALYQSLLVPKVEVKEIKLPNEIVMPQAYPENPEFTEIKEEQEKFEFTKVENIVKENKSNGEEKNETLKKLELYPVGLVMGTYIIAQNDEGMYLIDQHAAQERINYEKYIDNLKKTKITTTTLLIPITIELTPSDYMAVLKEKDYLENLGIKFQEFGINTIMITEHPTWLLPNYEEESLRKIIELVIEKNKFDPLKFNDHLAKTLACKMSVKGNTRITIEAMESLLDQLVLCDNPYNCPHGRPTIITFTKYELEKMFKRVMN